jgi:hypothetical protein
MTTKSCPQGGQSGGLSDRAYAKRDVIKTADWIINMGPEGGEVVAKGTSEKVVKENRSFTGRYLAPLLVLEAVAAE